MVVKVAKGPLSPNEGVIGLGGLTMTVVMQVKKLVAPLCYYTQGIFEESHDNQESADCGQVAVFSC